MREYLEMLKKSEMKKVINISSEAGSLSMHSWPKGEYAYCMSKCALNYASKIFNDTYMGLGIKVYAVDPGWMQTDMGYTGPGDPQPPIDPNETAYDILNLAEGENLAYIYCDRKGKKYDW